MNWELFKTMKTKKLFYVIFLLVLNLIMSMILESKQEINLHQIFDNRKIGFIDSTGKEIIKTIYSSAGEFSEGLASVRIKGSYGYINQSGEFVIQPVFDYATPFSEGLALVYIDGCPLYINKKGQKAFDINFSTVSIFYNGRAQVQTTSKKNGIIDKQGKLLIDTIYSKINPFVNGYAVVYGINHNPYPDSKSGIKKKLEIGIIDTLGNFIIPYGKYSQIYDYEGGYFKIEIPAEPWDTLEGYTEKIGFVDKNNNLILARDHSNSSWIDGNVHCGLAKINLYKYWLKEKDKDSYTTDKSYEGFINLQGEIVINDTNFKYVEDFSDNRAFVRDDDNNYFLINTFGKVIAKNSFSNIIKPGFKNGKAFVKVNRKWGLIDTNAIFLIKPVFDGIDLIGIIDDYFFFEKDSLNKEGNHISKYGISNIEGNILIQPVMQQFDRNGFQNGLLKCMLDDKFTYINKTGKIIWQEQSNKPKQLSNLNIDFMNRGYFCAYSKPNKTDIGGYGSSDNLPKKILNTDNFPQNQLSITLKPEIKDTIFGIFNGITVLVANTTKNEIFFNAENSRLYMKVQALNSKAEWKDIEYLPNSWCGNSYHILKLDSNYYWEFLTPVYEGEFKTKLRIELKLIDSNDNTEDIRIRKEIQIYSNEFEGSINPGQLWRKQEYYPNGIMDSYDE
jgi:hypothetical protein